MANDAYILKHYQKVAINYGKRPESTIQDPKIRELEVDFFLSSIESFIAKKGFMPKIADLGCGNGHLLSKISKHFPKCKIYGLEFTPELFKIARERDLPNCQIELGDIRLELFSGEKFDIIITERVIINLLSWKKQAKALHNIIDSLNQGGLYLMSESFREPWVELNLARAEMQLDEIPQSKHNRYLAEAVIPYLAKHGLTEILGTRQKNELSTHFYISRVLHQMIAPPGSRGKTSRFSDFFNQALPTACGNFSPILFRTLQKKVLIT